MTNSTRASYESARKLASPPVGSEVHAVHHGLNSSMSPASEMPPVPALDAEGLTLILAKILAQMEIQTEMMAASAKKADRDSLKTRFNLVPEESKCSGSLMTYSPPSA